MLEVAARAESLYALLVWDGNAGSDGGTGAVVSRLDGRIEDPTRIRIVDPVPRAYAYRQWSPGPKRILSLDGGGLRGVITLEILLSIERQLRQHFGRDDLVLADYFDYLAGTSTGAIIASALALGRPVEDIRDRYRTLGHAAFRRSLGALAQGARFGAEPVQRQLLDFFDDDLVLGDPALRTLLLLVLHRTDTDSPWLLSNCTNARYNRTDRLLPRHRHDRNLDLPLLSLIRASTAAPTYFPMQLIPIGGVSVPFQDGGVTAFNNPALIAAVMATLPAYGLQWNRGVDDLLVVSIGTGSRAATGRPSRPGLVSSLGSLVRLPSVFMNGSAFSQDLLCRVIGECRYGPALDSEVGALLGRQREPHGGQQETPAVPGAGGVPAVGEYFSFVRYDADLSRTALARTAVPRGDWRDVRRMDDARQIDNWRIIGRHAAENVRVAEHFRGFLQPADLGPR
jgi:predicted acylesterase/phospholipase RssA